MKINVLCIIFLILFIGCSRTNAIENYLDISLRRMEDGRKNEEEFMKQFIRQDILDRQAIINKYRWSIWSREADETIKKLEEGIIYVNESNKITRRLVKEYWKNEIRDMIDINDQSCIEITRKGYIHQLRISSTIT